MAVLSDQLQYPGSTENVRCILNILVCFIPQHLLKLSSEYAKSIFYVSLLNIYVIRSFQQKK